MRSARITLPRQKQRLPVSGTRKLTAFWTSSISKARRVLLYRAVAVNVTDPAPAAVAVTV